MKFSERFDLENSIGIFEIWESKKGIPIKLLTKQNLIVASARVAIRDLLHNASAGKVIAKVKFGDMNMNYGDNTDNLPQPSVTDMELVNEFYSHEFDETEVFNVDNRPAVKRTFYITEQDANDPNINIYNKLITEFGLTTNDDTLFSRIVIPIVKTRDIGLIINWTIII